MTTPNDPNWHWDGQRWLYWNGTAWMEPPSAPPPAEGALSDDEAPAVEEPIRPPADEASRPATDADASALPQPVERKNRTALVIVGVCILVVAALAGGAWWYTHRGTTIHGQLSLNSQDLAANGNGCKGSGGYADIAPGATVVVTDPHGTTIGVGVLTGGHYRINEGGQEDAYICDFDFDLSVPAQDFYGIAIGHRDPIQIPAAEAPDVELTLGS
jgi:hypothetical protein